MLDSRQDLQMSGVIWITGLSGAGKTTVGRKVEARLRSAGHHTIFLDGDDLRSIFAGRWGYEREDRVELAHVYFRLCSHLASQGATVIISAIAMYNEVRAWVRTNIPNSMEVYLDVPEEERRRRDAGTKQIYSKISDVTKMYDPPLNPDLVLNNYGTVTADAVAEQIASAYQRGIYRKNADKGRVDHWARFYSSGHAPSEPSSFAKDVAAKLSEPISLIEIGCGNGRDAAFFASLGHEVTAIDASDAAIALCNSRLADTGIRFLAGTLPAVQHRLGRPADVVYSRFVIHAMPEDEERAMLSAAAVCLKKGGRLFVECRSINDPMASRGEIISPTERIHGHYRRFIVLDQFRERLRAAGFHVTSEIESDGLAILGAENPVVIRVTAEKLQ